MKDIVTILRDAADDIEERQTQKIELPPAADLLTGVRTMREMMKEGRVSLHVSWGKYDDKIATRVSITDEHYKSIGEGGTVATAVEKAIRHLTPEPPVHAECAIEAALSEPVPI